LSAIPDNHHLAGASKARVVALGFILLLTALCYLNSLSCGMHLDDSGVLGKASRFWDSPVVEEMWKLHRKRSAQRCPEEG
jgi:hypothetical protein